MKYIILSFDDGLKDFVNNAEPILNKFNFKASINIISGFSEKQKHEGFEYISNNEIKLLHQNGYEICTHSDLHLNPTTINDFNVCRNKLSTLLNIDSFGAILPFSQNISEDMAKEFNTLKYNYLADFGNINRKRRIWLRILFFVNKIIKSSKISYLYNYSIYFYKRSDNFYTFRRLPIRKETKPKYLISLIKHMKNGEAVTLMFHSIVKDYDEKVPWPDGCWRTNDLNDLLAYLSSNKKKYKVIAQRDLPWEK